MGETGRIRRQGEEKMKEGGGEVKEREEEVSRNGSGDWRLISLFVFLVKVHRGSQRPSFKCLECPSRVML